MKKVVVTGATSMLGLAVVKKCISNGVEVVAIIRGDSGKRELLPHSILIKIVDADISQLADLRLEESDCDVFYHFAWTSTDKIGRYDPCLQSQNLIYTLDALRLAKRLGCKKFIGAGSQAEYGNHVDIESTPCSPINPTMAYGIAKYAAGKLGSVYADQLELDFIWVRIFSVYGPYELPTTMISTTIRKLRQGEHLAFTPAIHRWDYLYADDAAEAFYRIGKKVSGNKVFCLGSGQSRPLREYIQEITEVVAPGTELSFGEIPYSNMPLPSMCADISDLTKEIGTFVSTPFIEGIQKMISITSK